MYCQACGTDNASDARYCKHCGKPIAKPGMEGGPLTDVTSAGVGQPRDPDDASKEEAPEEVVATPGDNVLAEAEPGDTVKDPRAAEKAAEEAVVATPAVDASAVEGSAEATVKGVPVKRDRPSDSPAEGAKTIQGTPRAKGDEPVDDGGDSRDSASPSRPRLAPPTGHMPNDSMVASLSIRLSEVGVQSPRRLVGIALIVAVILFALGAGAMYLSVRGRIGPPTAVATSTPEEDRGLVIGMPVPESGGASEEDEPSGASTSGRRPGGGRRSSGSGSASGGGSSAQPESPSGGSSTPSGGGASATGGGSATTPETPSSASGETPSTEPDPPASGGGGSSAESSTGGGGTPSMPPDDGLEERDPEMGAYASQVRYVIRRFYAARAQGCFERASREHSEPVFGTVVIRFTIVEGGTVSSASAVRNTTSSSDLPGCLVGQVRSWRLPDPPGGNVTMEMPFSQ